MSKADTNIKQIFNETVLVLYDGKVDSSFAINCPFIPDEIQIQLAIVGIAVPLSTNLYTLESSFLGNQSIVQCNETNSYNPVMRFFNNERRSIQSSYSSRVRLHSGALLNGTVQISFVFIRFADKSHT